MVFVSFSDLRQFVSRLEHDRDLVTVDVPVDAYLEAAEIHRRVIAAGGPALLFTNIRTTNGERATSRLVTNLFGTAKRAELAFGERPHRLVRRAVELIETLLPPSPAALWGARDIAFDLMKIGTRYINRGPVLDQITTDIRLNQLPVLTCWPEDGGPFITLPLVYTAHPKRRGGHNLGIYRLQVHDRQTTGMHWQIGKGGGFHYAEAESLGEDLPVTVFLGGPPALMLAGVAPLPENVPELLLASLIAGERLSCIKGYGAHPIVATAEFSLMGQVPPYLRKSEGPFGDHYGYYSLKHDYPVFQVKQITHRSDPLYPATVVGKPRQEDFYIGNLLQELLSPLFPLVMPGVKRLWSYGETGYHSLAAAVVKERYRREAMASALRILGEGQLSLTKFLLVTDRDVDLNNFKSTLEHILARTQPETDLYVLGNMSMDTLDYTGPRVNEGSKGIWLGLGEPIRELPRVFSASSVPLGIFDIQVFCGGCLVIGGPAYEEEPDLASRVATEPVFSKWPLVVISDEPLRASASEMNFLWTTFTRFEPAADLHAGSRKIVRNHITYHGPIVLDARLKPGFPGELTCQDDIASRVSTRWKEYFPDGKVEMGDAERGHLD